MSDDKIQGSKGGADPAPVHCEVIQKVESLVEKLGDDQLAIIEMLLSDQRIRFTNSQIQDLAKASVALEFAVKALVRKKKQLIKEAR
jgi:hypothetical protein